MSGNGLSQEEINEMLNQELNKDTENTQEKKDVSLYLDGDEIDALGEIGNISMGSAATALFSILGRKVLITTPKVSITNYDELSAKRKVPYFIVSVDYTEGFNGSSIFVLQLQDVKVVTDIMMGGDGTNTEAEMDEIHISAISEAMNQMMGAMSTSMATMFDRKVNISPPKTKIVKLSDYDIQEVVESEKQELVRIDFALHIDGILESSIMQILPLEFAKYLLSGVLGEKTDERIEEEELKYEQKQEEIIETKGRTNKKIEDRENYSKTEEKSRPKYEAPQRAPSKPKETVEARSIQLRDFEADLDEKSLSDELGIDLLLDVPLQVKVELGKCKKNIKDILEMNLGSVIALDKMAGEPVDIVVNGKSIAKGEVVVIEDNYGVRITEISSPTSRIRR